MRAHLGSLPAVTTIGRECAASTLATDVWRLPNKVVKYGSRTISNIADAHQAPRFVYPSPNTTVGLQRALQVIFHSFRQFEQANAWHASKDRNSMLYAWDLGVLFQRHLVAQSTCNFLCCCWPIVQVWYNSPSKATH